MKGLRAMFRIILVSILTLIHLAVLISGLLVMIPLPRLRARWRMLLFRTWSRSLLPVMGVEVEAVGTPPDPPFLLVSNHLSYLDIPVIGSQVGTIFVAKSEISGWPMIGFVCRAVNTIFIDRTLRRDLPRVMREIEQELQVGMGVALFAEGTSSRGATVLPFRPSLLEPAVRSDLPVSYASLSYATADDDQPAHLAVCWWGGMDFSPHVLNLATLRRVQAKLVFGAERFHDTDRKRLAETLHSAVIDIFEPVVATDEH